SHTLQPILGIFSDIGYVGNPPVEDGATGRTFPARWRRVSSVDRFKGFGAITLASHESDQLAIERIHCSEIRSAQLSRIFGDRFEDWLHITLRLADHPQNLTRRSLLLQGFGESLVAILEFVE